MGRRTFNQAIGRLPAAIMMVAAMLPFGSQAASLSAKDVQVISKVFGFLDPPCRSGVVAVAYAPGDAASEADAAAVAALFGTGFKAGNTALHAEAVPISVLGHGQAYAAVILAAGVAAEGLAPLILADRLLCITADVRQVQAGSCILAVRTDPKVDIFLNRGLAAAAGVGFATAFRMLVHEL